MGTMCNQEPRPTRDITSDQMGRFVQNVKAFASEHNLSYDQALKTFELALYDRRTDVMIDDGNFTDENMCGIGTAIKEVAESLRDVASALDEFHRE